jgi:predicted nucleic acid-binding protein
MPDKAISNTSPLLYLHRCGGLAWLPSLFTLVCVPGAMAFELAEGRSRGFDAPNPEDHSWMKITDPQAMPSEWFAADLGAGEIAAMSLALEHPDHILLLDDALARRTAIAAGLTVWGTLRILLEAKSSGLIESVKPVIHRLEKSGMWVSEDIRRRVLALAGES